MNRIKRALGINGLTAGQLLIAAWSVVAFCLMACCSYERSAWYAMPLLCGNFIIASYFFKKRMPKTLGQDDEPDLEDEAW